MKRTAFAVLLITSERTTRADLGTPSRSTLQAMVCPGVSLPVQHRGGAGAVIRTFVGSAGVAVRNVSFSAAGALPLTESARADSIAAPLPVGNAALSGSVLRADGKPIGDEQVQVLGTTAATRADEQGNFAIGRLPAGTLELEVRQLGYAVVRRTVELRPRDLDEAMSIALPPRRTPEHVRCLTER